MNFTASASGVNWLDVSQHFSGKRILHANHVVATDIHLHFIDDEPVSQVVCPIISNM